MGLRILRMTHSEVVELLRGTMQGHEFWRSRGVPSDARIVRVAVADDRVGEVGFVIESSEFSEQREIDLLHELRLDRTFYRPPEGLRAWMDEPW